MVLRYPYNCNLDTSSVSDCFVYLTVHCLYRAVFSRAIVHENMDLVRKYPSCCCFNGDIGSGGR